MLEEEASDRRVCLKEMQECEGEILEQVLADNGRRGAEGEVLVADEEEEKDSKGMDEDDDQWEVADVAGNEDGEREEDEKRDNRVQLGEGSEEEEVEEEEEEEWEVRSGNEQEGEEDELSASGGEGEEESPSSRRRGEGEGSEEEAEGEEDEEMEEDHEVEEQIGDGDVIDWDIDRGEDSAEGTEKSVDDEMDDALLEEEDVSGDGEVDEEGQGEEVGEREQVVTPRMKRKLFSRFEIRPPPGAEDGVVLYTTTLRTIRKTFAECNRVRQLLQNLMLVFEERDVSIHAEYRQELASILDLPSAPVPHLFIEGRSIGGADAVITLHEDNSLRVLLDGVPRIRGPRDVCSGCGGHRFVPCITCSGSHKVILEDGSRETCPDCNENGLIHCPLCN
eukprot:TRINITY_DN10689_c0_g2_i2.p1 TRINITY_DN10689_c0_g2~~TRINITY_DN10689_c0_g2_i2.p1  ORF type:complete len:392 (-),score=135.98 TRINITY_DN10689_c0_g2_i2:830-2005(-)